MSIFDNLDIKPGYAVIYSQDGITYNDIFAKSTLEENGFTVLMGFPPCEELNKTIVVRRINLPNLDEEAYVYIKWEDFGSNQTETIKDFAKRHSTFRIHLRDICILCVRKNHAGEHKSDESVDC